MDPTNSNSIELLFYIIEPYLIELENNTTYIFLFNVIKKKSTFILIYILNRPTQTYYLKIMNIILKFLDCHVQKSQSHSWAFG